MGVDGVAVEIGGPGWRVGRGLLLILHWYRAKDF